MNNDEKIQANNLNMNALTKSTPLALINLTDCREHMTITLNEKDHQIKLAGTVDDPYFCGKDICGVLMYKDPKMALHRMLTTKTRNQSIN